MLKLVDGDVKEYEKAMERARAFALVARTRKM